MRDSKATRQDYDDALARFDEDIAPRVRNPSNTDIPVEPRRTLRTMANGLTNPFRRWLFRDASDM